MIYKISYDIDGNAIKKTPILGTPDGTKKCAWRGCRQKATELADASRYLNYLNLWSKKDKNKCRAPDGVSGYCLHHALQVTAIGEYGYTECRNCGCIKPEGN